MSKHSLRAFVTKSAILAAFGVAVLPSTANAGFFEDLFGGSRQAQPEIPVYEAPDQAMPYELDQRDMRRPRNVVEDEKPILQKTTDLWHDQTLRDGDAVMMKDGIRIYNGAEKVHHRASEFTRLGNTRDLSPKVRVALMAVDTTRRDPQMGAAPDTIASGRSAAVASPIVVGYKITDARGRSVRYVGP